MTENKFMRGKVDELSLPIQRHSAGPGPHDAPGRTAQKGRVEEKLTASPFHALSSWILLSNHRGKSEGTETGTQLALSQSLSCSMAASNAMLWVSTRNIISCLRRSGVRDLNADP